MSLKSSLENKVNLLFLVLTGFFVTNILVAEFLGVKIFSLERVFGAEPLNITVFGVEGLGLNLAAGVLLWPIVFVMTDIINEYFGPKRVRFLSYMTVGLIAYAFIMIYGAIHLAPNEWWRDISGTLSEDPGMHVANMDTAFRKIMGQGLGMIIGSMVAFLVGQIVDVYVFHRIKRFTGEKKVWLRATGSTLISQFIDSYVVLIIAFYIFGDWEFIRVVAVGIMGYTYKFFIAIILTPVIYFAHHRIDNYLGHDLAEKLKREAAGLRE